jgi:hypothetical protein
VFHLIKIPLPVSSPYHSVFGSPSTECFRAHRGRRVACVSTHQTPLRFTVCWGDPSIVSTTSESSVRGCDFRRLVQMGSKVCLYLLSQPLLSQQPATITTVFVTSLPPRWCLELLTIGQVYHMVDIVFRHVTLENFPAPHPRGSTPSVGSASVPSSLTETRSLI